MHWKKLVYCCISRYHNYCVQLSTVLPVHLPGT